MKLTSPFRSRCRFRRAPFGAFVRESPHLPLRSFPANRAGHARQFESSSHGGLHHGWQPKSHRIAKESGSDQDNVIRTVVLSRGWNGGQRYCQYQTCRHAATSTKCPRFDINLPLSSGSQPSARFGFRGFASEIRATERSISVSDKSRYVLSRGKSSLRHSGRRESSTGS